MRSLRVLHVYTEHRGKGGAEHFAEVNMQLSRQNGLAIDLFIRTSSDLPQNILGKLQAGAGAISKSRSLPEFEAKLKSFQPDIVHLYDYFPLISPWVAPMCARKGIPVVLHCVHYRLTCPIATHFTGGELCTRCTGGREHWAVIKNCRQNLPESITVALHNTLVRKTQVLTKHVNCFIAPSDFTRDWLIQHGNVGSARVATVMPFIDVPATETDAGAGSYIAFAGRYAEEKGIATLLEAARLTGLPVRLCRNRKHAVTIKLPGAVDEVITDTREELAEFYRGARMLVFPSLWFETFGLVGAEAMSHGVPVVAARIGALANLVDDGVNGLFFEPGNSTDLAVKMKRLWEDRDLCRQFGRAARQKALAEWTVDKYFERLMSLYGEVTGGADIVDNASVDSYSNL